MLPDSLGRRRADCDIVLQAQWLRIFRSGRALATSADRSDALYTLHAMDCMTRSLIARAILGPLMDSTETNDRMMREQSEALLCVAPGKPVDYFV